MRLKFAEHDGWRVRKRRSWADPFRELPDVPPRWVRPRIVVEVEYRQRTLSGLRHAALRMLRFDRYPRQVFQPHPLDHGPFVHGFPP